jgi:hypothetical protein
MGGRMFGKHIDFVAVLIISLMMLGFAEARSWHFSNALDSIRFQNAIEIERCPLSSQVLSSLSWFLR